MWQEWVQLAGLGTITCLLLGNIGKIVAVPGGADLSLTALRECAQSLQPVDIRRRTNSSKKRKPSLPRLVHSMYRDLLQNASVEVDTILGDLVDRGSKHGVSTPILQAAFVNLSIYQRGRSIDRSKITSLLV